MAQADTVFTLTAPLHARLLASPSTILATVRASRVPERMLSPAFRRATRPRRRLAVSGGPTAIQRPSLLSRVNSGEIAVVPPPKPPDGMVSIDQVSDQISNPADQKVAKHWRLVLLLLIVVALVLALLAGAVAGIAGAIAALAVLAVGAAAALAYYKKAQAALAGLAVTTELQVSSFTPQAVASIPPQSGFQVLAAGTAPAASGGAAAGGTADSAAAAQFRAATSDLFTYLGHLPVDPPQAAALDLVGLRTTLLARLDPAVTVPRRVNSRIALKASLVWAPVDPIEPIMAAPEFDQPMYAPLRDLSEQYVLPGVELVPPNTVGLVLANHAFIEAYMVGLNHEMARQLLWNDYPTDQRGSYFRQFWDVSAYVPQKGDPTDPAALAELVKDIPPINTWPLPVPLGQHPNRTDVALNNVVLLVRGELFKRYPTAIVYAAKAKKTGTGLDIDETDERYPIFSGQLSTDITFLGFNLGLDDARGGTASSPDGFFFVFQEQPSEPRFGLEPTERANPTVRNGPTSPGPTSAPAPPAAASTSSPTSARRRAPSPSRPAPGASLRRSSAWCSPAPAPRFPPCCVPRRNRRASPSPPAPTTRTTAPTSGESTALKPRTSSCVCPSASSFMRIPCCQPNEHTAQSPRESRRSSSRRRCRRRRRRRRRRRPRQGPRRPDPASPPARQHRDALRHRPEPIPGDRPDRQRGGSRRRRRCRRALDSHLPRSDRHQLASAPAHGAGDRRRPKLLERHMERWPSARVPRHDSSSVARSCLSVRPPRAAWIALQTTPTNAAAQPTAAAPDGTAPSPAPVYPALSPVDPASQQPATAALPPRRLDRRARLRRHHLHLPRHAHHARARRRPHARSGSLSSRLAGRSRHAMAGRFQSGPRRRHGA